MNFFPVYRYLNHIITSFEVPAHIPLALLIQQKHKSDDIQDNYLLL